jgi:hypothetical protein
MMMFLCSSAGAKVRDLFFAVKKMKKGQNRVAPEHPGTGIAHDLSCPCLHLFIITVNGTVAAGWLPVAKRAMGQPAFGILEKLMTFLTNLFRLAMLQVMSTTIDFHHRGYRG